MEWVTVTKSSIMDENTLRKIAYQYYPKNVDALNEQKKYLNSVEFQNLKNIIFSFKNDFSSFELNDYKKNISNLSNDIKFVDATLFDWLDRAYNFQLYKIINNKIYSLCINISFLVPFFTYYTLELEIDKVTGVWKSYPKENENIKEKYFKKEVLDLYKMTVECLGLSLFPKEIENKILEDISFQDIKEGELTFFNAFFLNEKNIRL